VALGAAFTSRYKARMASGMPQQISVTAAFFGDAPCNNGSSSLSCLNHGRRLGTAHSLVVENNKWAIAGPRTGHQ